ncbi:hypothetical protein M5K25_000180 [Dendrobium thyrsiflorum]|uniref:Uncharacterized protein n=1 Tax=Dendrobium thyrsiflorum TaxID=117978 RepID=A0ABD0VSZ0_DENTH
MTDRGKEPVSEESRSLDSLWANQESVNRRIDDLAAEVQRLTLEIRREFNLNRARPPHQRMPREEPPVIRPLRRRGLAADRHWRQQQTVLRELSDSDEEAQMYRGNVTMDSGVSYIVEELESVETFVNFIILVNITIETQRCLCSSFPVLLPLLFSLQVP